MMIYALNHKSVINFSGRAMDERFLGSLNFINGFFRDMIWTINNKDNILCVSPDLAFVHDNQINTINISGNREVLILDKLNEVYGLNIHKNFEEIIQQLIMKLSPIAIQGKKSRVWEIIWIAKYKNNFYYVTVNMSQKEIKISPMKDISLGIRARSIVDNKAVLSQFGKPTLIGQMDDGYFEYIYAFINDNIQKDQDISKCKRLQDISNYYHFRFVFNAKGKVMSIKSVISHGKLKMLS